VKKVLSPKAGKRICIKKSLENICIKLGQSIYKFEQAMNNKTGSTNLLREVLRMNGFVTANIILMLIIYAAVALALYMIIKVAVYKGVKQANFELERRLDDLTLLLQARNKSNTQ